MKGAWPDDNTFPDNWGSAAEKQKKISRKRRQTDHELDLNPIEPTSDEKARACAVTVCGNALDADEARMFLDQLGILRQVRGEPDPDRYLAHCFNDLRRPRMADGSMAMPASCPDEICD